MMPLTWSMAQVSTVTVAPIGRRWAGTTAQGTTSSGFNEEVVSVE